MIIEVFKVAHQWWNILQIVRLSFSFFRWQFEDTNLINIEFRLFWKWWNILSRKISLLFLTKLFSTFSDLSFLTMSPWALIFSCNSALEGSILYKFVKISNFSIFQKFWWHSPGKKSSSTLQHWKSVQKWY